MDESADPVPIPIWFWLIPALLIGGFILLLMLRGSKGRSSRRHRHRSEGSKHRSGHSSSRSRRRRSSDPFEKY